MDPAGAGQVSDAVLELAVVEAPGPVCVQAVLHDIHLASEIVRILKVDERGCD